MLQLEKVPLQQAAAELCVSQATLRSWMRHRVINIGNADKKDGNIKCSYTIYRHLLDRYKESITGGHADEI